MPSNYSGKLAYKYTCKVELVENAAWGKLSAAWWWALLEAPQDTGPVHQLHGCSIARDFWTLSFVFAVTLCCTDSIWKGWKMRFRFLQQRSTLRSPHWCFSSHDYRGIFSCCYLALTLLIQLCSDKCKIEDIIFLKRGHNFAETEGAERHEILLMLWSKPSDDYAPGTKHSLINYSKVYYWSPKPPLFALYMWRGEKEWWQYWVNVGFVEKKLEFPTKLVWKGENTCWSIWFTPHKLIHVCGQSRRFTLEYSDLIPLTWVLWSFRSHPLRSTSWQELNAPVLEQLWVPSRSSESCTKRTLLRRWLVGHLSTGPWPKPPPSEKRPC